MTSIAVFDPGTTTGVVLASFTPTTPIEIRAKLEIPGGLNGLCEFLWSDLGVGSNEEEYWVCEKFRMTPRARTQVQVEPLRLEGAIALAHAWVVWQYNDQLLIGGAGHGSPSRNKTAADNVLRSMGLWTLPSEVDNHTDANDINSAMKHLVAYLRNHDHEPTLEALNAVR